MNPMLPIPAGWQPSTYQWDRLHQEFGSEIDLTISCRRFVAFYSEGQTSRDWSAKFERWVLEDVTRLRERKGPGVETDDLGIPITQKRSKCRELAPGEPGYASIDDLAEWARRGAAS
jgi:hypothetical protein